MQSHFVYAGMLSARSWCVSTVHLIKANMGIPRHFVLPAVWQW